MVRLLLALGALLPTTLGHFHLDYPTVRGYDEDKLASFPCGGEDSVSEHRTSWPINGGAIQLSMGHQLTNVQVLLAVGDNPGSAFSHVLSPTFTIQGIGKYCVTNVMIPSNVNVTDGMKATIQVSSNNEKGGGLYNCADITFVNNSTSGDCTNGTGVTAVPYKDSGANANTTSASTASDTTGGNPSTTKSAASQLSSVRPWTLVFGGALTLSVLLI